MGPGREPQVCEYYELVSEFEFACRGGDYEFADEYKAEIIKRLEEIARLREADERECTITIQLREANKILEAERDMWKRGYYKDADAVKLTVVESLQRKRDEAELRAIQAEQERDSLALRLKNESYLVQVEKCKWKDAEWISLRAVQERNALLEGLKWYADKNRYYTLNGESLVMQDCGEHARSIIVKIEEKG